METKIKNKNKNKKYVTNLMAVAIKKGLEKAFNEPFKIEVKKDRGADSTIATQLEGKIETILIGYVSLGKDLANALEKSDKSFFDLCKEMATFMVKDEKNKNSNFILYMGNQIYKIKLVSQEELQKHIVNADDGYYFGQTRFLENTIYLDKNLSSVRLEKTLIHELMHCYVREYVTTSDETYSEDEMCDLIANAYGMIEDILHNFRLFYLFERTKKICKI